MAMNVSFKKGLKAALPSTRDANTFYYVSDEFALYLGDHLISNEVTLEMFNAIEERVKALEDANFQDKIDAINETLKSIATSETVTAIDNRLKVVEGDYLKSTDKTALQAEIDADVKVVSDYIAENEAKWSEKYDDTALAGRVTAVEAVADAAQTAQEVSDAIDAKITALDLDNTYDAKNSAAQALTDAKGYVDGKFTDAKLDQYTTEQEVKDIVDEVISAAADVETTITGLTELVDYIEKHGGDASAMATDIGVLKGKVDVIEKKPAYLITSTQVSNWDGEVGAKAFAQGVKDVVDTNKATWDKAGTALQAADLADYAKTADIEDSLALADTAVQPAAIADMATKTEVAKDYATKAELELVNDKVTFPGYEDNIPVLTSSVGLSDGSPIFRDSGVSINDLAKQADFDKYVEDHKDDYTNTQIDAAIKVASDAAAAAAGLVGVSASVENGPTGVYAAIQGATTNTVKDCVDSINAVTTQLTWGSF